MMKIVYKKSFLGIYFIVSASFVHGMQRSSIEEAQWAQRVILLTHRHCERPINYLKHILPWCVKKYFLKKYISPLCLKEPQLLLNQLLGWLQSDSLWDADKLAYFLKVGIDPYVLKVGKDETLLSRIKDKKNFCEDLSEAIINNEQDKIKDIIVYNHMLSSKEISSYLQLLPPDLNRFFLKKYLVAMYQKIPRQTYYHMAELLDNRDFDTVRILLEYGVDFHKAFKPRLGLLQHAVTLPCSRAAKLLLSYNANINGRDYGNRNSLEEALRVGSHTNAACLLEHGVAIEKPRYCFEFAIGSGNISCIQLLLKKGLCPNNSVEDGHNYSLLHYSIGYCSLAATELLLQHNADPNAVSYEGTLLHYVLKFPGIQPKAAFIKLLLAYGADPHRPHENLLPIDLDISPEIKKILTDAMAKLKKESGEK